MEKKHMVATAEIDINEGAGKVWEALTEPAKIKEYMFGATVTSKWEKGSPITWNGEMQGKKYEDKGEIVAIEKEKKLAYTHYSPLSGQPDVPENYHTVTITLGEQDDKTHVVLQQDNVASEKEQAESEKNWKAMLEGLKKVVEA